jgi:hypothetical protein
MVSTIEMCIGVLSETTISRLHFQNFPGLFAICHDTCQVTSVQRSPGSRQGLQSYHASMRVQDRKLVVVQGSFMLFSTAFARKGSKKNSRKRRRKLKCMWGASESARQGSCCLECWKHMPRSWLPGWAIESLNKLAVFGFENILRDCLACQCEGCKANRKSCKMT